MAGEIQGKDQSSPVITQQTKPITPGQTQGHAAKIILSPNQVIKPRQYHQLQKHVS